MVYIIFIMYATAMTFREDVVWCTHGSYVVYRVVIIFIVRAHSTSSSKYNNNKRVCDMLYTSRTTQCKYLSALWSFMEFCRENKTKITNWISSNRSYRTYVNASNDNIIITTSHPSRCRCRSAMRTHRNTITRVNIIGTRRMIYSVKLTASRPFWTMACGRYGSAQQPKRRCLAVVVPLTRWRGGPRNRREDARARANATIIVVNFDGYRWVTY